MDNYIALLLLVMPGFVARKIYKHTNDIREDLNTFEETMYCLLNSVLIILVLLGIFSMFANGTAASCEELFIRFTNIKFICAYGFVALTMACILGTVTHLFRGGYEWVINFIRRKKGIALLAISQDVLDQMLLSNGAMLKTQDGIMLPRLIEIYKDGNMIARGSFRFGNMKYREFVLENKEDDIKALKENKKMPPVKNIYIDGRLGLTIKEYDFSGYVLDHD